MAVMSGLVSDKSVGYDERYEFEQYNYTKLT